MNGFDIYILHMLHTDWSLGKNLGQLDRGGGLGAFVSHFHGDSIAGVVNNMKNRLARNLSFGSRRREVLIQAW